MRTHVVTFAFEEKHEAKMAEEFGMAEDRFTALATDLVKRMVEAGKGATEQNPGSLAAVIMDYVEELDMEERGPFLAAATCGFFAIHYQTRMAQSLAQKFFESMGGGEVRP